MASESPSSGKIVAGAVAVGAAAAAVGTLASHLSNLSGASVMGDAKLSAAFLNRATFGATDASVTALSSMGVDAWIQNQTLAAPTPGGGLGFWTATPNFHLTWVMRRATDFQNAYDAA